MFNINETHLCMDCAYFNIENLPKVTCDVDKFAQTDFYKAAIYIPENFDCEEYIKIKEDF